MTAVSNRTRNRFNNKYRCVCSALCVPPFSNSLFDIFVHHLFDWIRLSELTFCIHRKNRRNGEHKKRTSQTIQNLVSLCVFSRSKNCSNSCSRINDVIEWIAENTENAIDKFNNVATGIEFAFASTESQVFLSMPNDTEYVTQKEFTLPSNESERSHLFRRSIDSSIIFLNVKSFSRKEKCDVTVDCLLTACW